MVTDITLIDAYKSGSKTVLRGVYYIHIYIKAILFIPFLHRALYCSPSLPSCIYVMSLCMHRRKKSKSKSLRSPMHSRSISMPNAEYPPPNHENAPKQQFKRFSPMPVHMQPCKAHIRPSTNPQQA